MYKEQMHLQAELFKNKEESVLCEGELLMANNLENEGII